MSSNEGPGIAGCKAWMETASAKAHSEVTDIFHLLWGVHEICWQVQSTAKTVIVTSGFLEPGYTSLSCNPTFP